MPNDEHREAELARVYATGGLIPADTELRVPETGCDYALPPAVPVSWFRRMPVGGTAFVRPDE